MARRWMAVISEDLPDYALTQGWSDTCGDRSFRIPSGERIDDLRIYVTIFDPDHHYYADSGRAQVSLLRESSYLPVVGCMSLNSRSIQGDFHALVLHEIGHLLGFGAIWDELGFFQNPPDGDSHFSGPLAIAAFDDAGRMELHRPEGTARKEGWFPLEEIRIWGRSHGRGWSAQRDHGPVSGRSRLWGGCHAGRPVYPAWCRICQGKCEDRRGNALDSRRGCYAGRCLFPARYRSALAGEHRRGPALAFRGRPLERASGTVSASGAGAVVQCRSTEGADSRGRPAGAHHPHHRQRLKCAGGTHCRWGCYSNWYCCPRLPHSVLQPRLQQHPQQTGHPGHAEETAGSGTSGSGPRRRACPGSSLQSCDSARRISPGSRSTAATS